MINHAVLRIKSVAVLVVVALLAVTVTTTALAEGSRNLTDAGGDRAFTEWASGTTGGIDRQTVVKVFVNSGEEIRFGSSVAASINDPADILWRAPDGTTGTCNVQASGSGLIDTLAKEDAGPLPNTGGYDPCILLPGQTGIYEFEFYAPATSGNPPLTGVNDPFPTDGTQGSTVAAWDVTVLATPGDAGTEVTGRVFANYLSLNMGANGAALNPTLYVLTEDGYLYIVDLNSIDPFGFIFFSNNTGFKDADTGESVYRSVLTSEIGSTITLHNPADPDTSSDITMKIFFNPPASDLPETALAPNPDGGAPITTWLLRQTPIEPELPTQFTFVGAENDTPGQAAAGVGGRFVVDVPAGIVGSVTVSLDITGDGDVMDPEDVVLFRAIDSTGGAYTEEIPWTGADGTGSFDYIDTLPNRTLDAAAVQVVTNVGEVHFPFLDVESGANGFIIERAVSPLNPTPVSSLVFYDDSASALNPQPGEIAPNPRSALTGIDSAPGGAHGFDNNWGNEKGVDTWTFVESTTSLTLDTDITFGTADLAITKIDQTDPVVPGETFRYTITVTNNGPLPVVDAIVADDLPGYLTNVFWACTDQSTIGGEDCNTSINSGDLLDAVDIPVGGFVEFQIQSKVPADRTEPVVNTATVSRGLDTTDETPDNNSDTEVTNLEGGTEEIDLGIEITQDATVRPEVGYPLILHGTTVTYTLTGTNLDPLQDATNVAYLFAVPAGSVVDSADASCAAPVDDVVTCDIGTLLANDSQSIDITLTTEPLPTLENFDIQVGIQKDGQFDQINPSNNTADTYTVVAVDVAQNGSFEVDDNGDDIADGWLNVDGDIQSRVCAFPPSYQFSTDGNCSHRFVATPDDIEGERTYIRQPYASGGGDNIVLRNSDTIYVRFDAGFQGTVDQENGVFEVSTQIFYSDLPNQRIVFDIYDQGSSPNVWVEDYVGAFNTIQSENVVGIQIIVAFVGEVGRAAIDDVEFFIYREITD